MLCILFGGVIRQASVHPPAGGGCERVRREENQYLLRAGCGAGCQPEFWSSVPFTPGPWALTMDFGR
jgi:hypothetical protein